MTFFQNPFTTEFRGSLVLGDRGHIPNFICDRNHGRNDEFIISWGTAPFDLSGNDADGNSEAELTLNFTTNNNDYKDWTSITFDITTTTADTSAVTVPEIVSSLSANTQFSARWEASTELNNGKQILNIRSKQPSERFRFYVSNIGAETLLRFNQKAGIAELPTYFSRHTVDNSSTYDDNVNLLIELDPGIYTIDANVINNAVNYNNVSLGLDASIVQEDWQLLNGQSGLFQFVNVTSAGAVSTTKVEIIYSAGSVAGDLALKVTTQEDASGNLVAKFEEPYTLTNSDLITPP